MAASMMILKSQLTETGFVFVGFPLFLQLLANILMFWLHTCDLQSCAFTLLQGTVGFPVNAALPRGRQFSQDWKKSSITHPAQLKKQTFIMKIAI